MAKSDKYMAVAEMKGPLILARTLIFGQMNSLTGFVYSVKVDCQYLTKV